MTVRKTVRKRVIIKELAGSDLLTSKDRLLKQTGEGLVNFVETETTPVRNFSDPKTITFYQMKNKLKKISPRFDLLFAEMDSESHKTIGHQVIFICTKSDGRPAIIPVCRVGRNKSNRIAAEWEGKVVSWKGSIYNKTKNFQPEFQGMDERLDWVRGYLTTLDICESFFNNLKKRQLQDDEMMSFDELEHTWMKPSFRDSIGHVKEITKTNE